MQELVRGGETDAFHGQRAQRVLPCVEAAAQQLPKYEVTGFRDAKFGMTEAEATVVKSYGVKPEAISTTTNPIEGTTLLTATVASLDPAPGAARIGYIFATSRRS